MPPDVPDGDGGGGDEAAVEDPTRAHEREDLGRALPEVVEVHDEQQQLGADDGADDDPDSEVEHALLLEILTDHGVGTMIKSR